MRGTSSNRLPVLQAGPPSPEASFVGDLETESASASGSQILSAGSSGDLELDASADIDIDAVSERDRLDAKSDMDVDMEREGMSPSPSTPRTRASAKGKGKATRPKLAIRSGNTPETPQMAINHSHPPTRAQNGLMSPPTPAPSPTPGRNGWWGTVPRGPMQPMAMSEGEKSAGGLELERESGELAAKVDFDPQQLLEAFPSLPPPTRLALISALLPMLTTPELLMLSSHIGPRLKRDFLRDLPQEIALHVLSFVDDARTLARASCVSWHWHKLLEDEHTWKEMCERHRLNPSQSFPNQPMLPGQNLAAPQPPSSAGITRRSMDGDAEMGNEERPPVIIPSSTNGYAPAYGITGPDMFVATRVNRNNGVLETYDNRQPAHGYPVPLPGGERNAVRNVQAAFAQLPANFTVPPLPADLPPMPTEGQINGQLPPLPSVVAPGAAALSTARRSQSYSSTSRASSRSGSSDLPRMSNVRGDSFGLTNIEKKVKEDGFSYKKAFKKAYLTESNWLRGGNLLSSHTSADDGVVTSLAVDSDYIIIGMANSKIHVFSAHTGHFMQSLVGHTLGVWCLTLVTPGGGPIVEEGLDDDASSDDTSVPPGAYERRLRSYKGDKRKPNTASPSKASSSRTGQATKSRKRARPGMLGRGSSEQDQTSPSPSSGPAFPTLSNFSSRFNFNAPSSPSRGYYDPDTPPGDESEARPNRARRMEQSDVCGAARGWGQDRPIVVSGGCDRDVRVWDLKTGFCLHVLRGHVSTIRCLKVIDGRPIAVSGSRDATLKVWDIEKGRHLHSLVGHQHSVRCIEVAGNQVVSGSYDCTCRIWDVDTGECLQVLRGHYHQIYAVAFDGERVATGSLDSTVRIWSAATGDCVALLQGHTSLVGQLQLSGDTLVTGGSDGRVIIFDLVNYTCLQRICAHDNSVTCLQFDERYIVSGGNDGRVKLWDIKTGNFIRELSKPCEAVWRVTFRDDKCAILCKRDGKTVLEVLSFIPQEDDYTSTRNLGTMTRPIIL